MKKGGTPAPLTQIEDQASQRLEEKAEHVANLEEPIEESLVLSTQSISQAESDQIANLKGLFDEKNRASHEASTEIALQFVKLDSQRLRDELKEIWQHNIDGDLSRRLRFPLLPDVTLDFAAKSWVRGYEDSDYLDGFIFAGDNLVGQTTIHITPNGVVTAYFNLGHDSILVEHVSENTFYSILHVPTTPGR